MQGFFSYTGFFLLFLTLALLITIWIQAVWCEIPKRQKLFHLHLSIYPKLFFFFFKCIFIFFKIYFKLHISYFIDPSTFLYFLIYSDNEGLAETSLDLTVMVNAD